MTIALASPRVVRTVTRRRRKGGPGRGRLSPPPRPVPAACALQVLGTCLPRRVGAYLGLSADSVRGDSVLQVHRRAQGHTECTPSLCRTALRAALLRVGGSPARLRSHDSPVSTSLSAKSSTAPIQYNILQFKYYE